MLFHFSNADKACFGNSGNIGQASCDGLRACEGNTGEIGNNGACATTEKTAGDSDNPEGFTGVCMLNQGSIGDSACSAEGACFENTNDIGTRSCKGCEHILIHGILLYLKLFITFFLSATKNLTLMCFETH